MPGITSNIIELSVFCRKGTTVRYLLLRRARDEKLYPNIWQFITGKIKKKEDAITAAIRELKEETALKPKMIWVVPGILSFYDPDSDIINLSPFLAVEVDYNVKVKLSHEHDKSDWFTYKEAVRRLIWPSQREGLKIVKNFIIEKKKTADLTRIKL